MSCSTTTVIARRRVWTRRTANVAAFVPFVQGEIDSVAKVKASYNLRARTSTHLSIRCSVQYSYDGVSWSLENLGSWVTTEGWQQLGLSDLLSTFRYFRVGIEATNTSTTDLEFADVELDLTLVGR